MKTEHQNNKASERQTRPPTRRVLVLSAALLFCCSAVLPSPGCGSSSQSLNEHRSKLNSEVPAQLFDKQVREFWSLGMTREEVQAAAPEARLRITTTQDARALREIDPAYDDRPALVARIIPSGIFIDAKHFEARRKVGWLYFFFDASDRLRLVSYRLSDEQERELHTKTRVILPQETAP